MPNKHLEIVEKNLKPKYSAPYEEYKKVRDKEKKRSEEERKRREETAKMNK